MEEVSTSNFDGEDEDLHANDTLSPSRPEQGPLSTPMQVKIRCLDGIEYSNLMDWQPRHWKTVEGPFNSWATNPFTCSETLLNLAGNAFSPYSWIAVQMSLLATQGYFTGTAAVQRELGVTRRWLDSNADEPAVADDPAVAERKFEDPSDESEAFEDEWASGLRISSGLATDVKSGATDDWG